MVPFWHGIHKYNGQGVSRHSAVTGVFKRHWGHSGHPFESVSEYCSSHLSHSFNNGQCCCGGQHTGHNGHVLVPFGFG